MARFRGENNKHSKLTHKAVEEIRSRYAIGGISQQALANEYGISLVQTNRVIHGKRWSSPVDELV